MEVVAAGSRWVDQLSDEDLAFLKRFVLSSGSLKETAKLYGISYPTVRLRLDRLIQKIELLQEHRRMGPLERELRKRYADRAIDLATLKALLAAHREEMEIE